MRGFLAVVGAGVTLSAAACRHGAAEEGMRIDLEGLTEPEVGYVELRAVCPPGRVTVHFRPGRHVSARGERGLLGAASLREIVVNCASARKVSRPHPVIEARGPWESARRATTLRCSFRTGFELSVNPVFFENGPLDTTEFSIYDVRSRIKYEGRNVVYPRPLVVASLDGRGDPRLLWKSPPCRVNGRP